MQRDTLTILNQTLRTKNIIEKSQIFPNAPRASEGGGAEGSGRVSWNSTDCGKIAQETCILGHPLSCCMKITWGAPKLN